MGSRGVGGDTSFLVASLAICFSLMSRSSYNENSCKSNKYHLLDSWNLVCGRLKVGVEVLVCINASMKSKYNLLEFLDNPCVVLCSMDISY